MKKLLFAMALMPFLALADQTKVGDVTWSYDVANGKATVTGADPATGMLEIPLVLNGFAVTSVGDRAFRWCGGLTSVTIPSSVTNIGDGAFNGCSGLKSVTIPSSVTSIGDGAFYDCGGLMSVKISDITAWCGIVFASSSANPLSYAHALILDGKRVTDLQIPSSMTSVGDYTFYGCSVKSVTIPSSVTSIGAYAFGGCSGLTSVTIPFGVRQIGRGAFSGCGGLKDVAIPPGVTSIRSDAFSGCGGLVSVTIPAFVSAAPLSTLFPDSYGQIKSVIICDDTTSIARRAFYGCGGLTSVTIPSSVMSIGEEAFCGCSGLTTVTIPSSVSSIGDYAFYSCLSLRVIHVSNNGDVDVIKQMLYKSGFDVASVIFDYVEEPVCAQYKVTFDAQGGVAEWMDENVYSHEDIYSLAVIGKLPTASRPGFWFVGWFTAADGGTRILSETMVMGDVTVYAHWISKKESPLQGLVSWYKFDGDLNCADKIGGPSLSGTVGAWVEDRNGEPQGAVRFDGASELEATSDGAIVEDDMSLSVWVKPSGDVRTEKSEGTSGGDTSWMKNQTLLFPAHGGDPSTGRAGVGLVVGRNGVMVAEHAGGYAPATLVWYGDVGEEWTLVTVTIEENGAPNLYINGEFVKSGLKSSKRKFVGFKKSESLTVIGGGPYGHYSGAVDDLRIYNRALSDEEVAILYASGVDEPGVTTYTVTFNANGGMCSTLSKQYADGSAVGALPTVERDGHEFLGWFTAMVGGTQVTAETVVTKDVTFYAHWRRIGSTADEEIISGKKITIETGLKGYKASGLPKGLTYDAKTGKITGTATKVTALEGVVVKFTKSGAETEELMLAVRAEEVSAGCEILATGSFPAGVVGAAGGIPLQIETETGVKSVSVTKLPSGMKYDSKNRLITGTPTTAGNYTVVLTVTTKTGAKKTVKIPVTVEAMPVMASGTFSGFVSVGEDDYFGTFTLTATSAGKLTAKAVTAKGTYSFSKTGWDSVAEGVYSATLKTKKGDVLTLTLDSTLGWDKNQLWGDLTTAEIAATKKTAAVPSYSYGVSAQRRAFGKIWYFTAAGDVDNGWTLAYTENAKAAALTVTLKADGSTAIAGTLPGLLDAKKKAVKLSASGYANVGGITEGVIMADFAPIVTVNKVKTALAIKTNLWFDRCDEHPEGVGEVKFVK